MTNVLYPQITADLTEDIQRELKQIGTGATNSRETADADTEEAVSDIEGWDFVWYSNPKPTIAQEATLFHVQVFWTDSCSSVT